VLGISLLAATTVIGVFGPAPLRAPASSAPALLQTAIIRTISVSSCEITMSNSIAGAEGKAIYESPGRWLGPSSAHVAGGLIVGDLEYAVVTEASGLRVVSSGPTSHLSASGGLTPAQLTAFDLLLSARSASGFKAVNGGWTFSASSTHPAVRSGALYLRGDRVVKVDVDELEQGRVVRLQDQFSSFDTAPRLRLPANI
jgi:hypothetical protein